MSEDEFKEFLQGYLVCALWSSTDESDDSGGVPMDSIYGIEDLHETALASATESCKDFADANKDALIRVVNTPGYEWSSAGHDFWLTRNGHGAGFWDRGLGHDGDLLSEAARVYGSCDLYVGDDDRLYFQ